MLERLDSPPTVLAFKAVGTIGQRDYEDVLKPAVEQMMSDHGELRFAYVMGSDFDGYSLGGEWEDAKLGIGHLFDWKRCAVATDHDWVRHLMGMFGWMMTGDVKVFPGTEVDDAITWAAG